MNGVVVRATTLPEQRLLAIIQEHDGAWLSDLRELPDLPLTNRQLAHDLDYLEAEGQIVRVPCERVKVVQDVAITVRKAAAQ
jgi:hypothetical protein